MTKEEFIQRFVDRVIKVTGEHFANGESVRDYASDVAPTYWENPDQRSDGPEECADSDMSYWGD